MPQARVSRLLDEVASGLSAHAYIIEGPAEDTSFAAAQLSAALVCSSEGKRPCGQCRHCRKAERGSHPDIIAAGEPGESFKIKDSRFIKADAGLYPNEAERKVYIIPGADDMTPPAQDALLKALEEPPPFVVFIICCERRESLLETVRSRCRLFRTGSKEAVSEGKSAAAARDFLAALVKGDELSLLTLAMSKEKYTREDYRAFIAALSSLLRDALVCRFSSYPSGCVPEAEAAATALTSRVLLRLSERVNAQAEALTHNANTAALAAALAAGSYNDISSH